MYSVCPIPSDNANANTVLRLIDFVGRPEGKILDRGSCIRFEREAVRT